MPPALEFAALALKPGLKLDQPESAEGRVWTDCLDTIRSQDGCERICWGARVEDSDIIDLIVVWRDIQDHFNFMADPSYQPFLSKFASVLAGPVPIFHFHPASLPAFDTAVAAPVTEVVFCYTSLSADKSAFDGAVAEFLSVAEKEAKGSLGFAGGWAVEEAEHKSLADEGGKGRRFVLLLGWQSVEAHMQYRDTQAFKDSIPLLRNNVKGAEMHHAPFTTA